MLARIKEKTVGFFTEKECHDKFFILSSDIYYFRTFTDYIKFYEVAHSILGKVNLPDGMRVYFANILSMLSSCKDLYVENFGEDTKSFDAAGYSDKVMQVVNNFGNSYLLDEEHVTVLDMKDVSAEEFDQYNDKNSKEYPSEVLIFSKEREGMTTYYNVVLTNELHNNYSRHIVGIQEKITGDFYTDLFLTLIDEMAKTKLSRSCMNFNIPLITEQGIHESVAVGIGFAVQALAYFKNCSSFKRGILEPFDEIEIEKRIEAVLAFFNRAADTIK